MPHIVPSARRSRKSVWSTNRFSGATQQVEMTMTQRTMLILAAVLSVFALVLVGGLATRLTVQPSATPTPQATAMVAAQPTPQAGLDPTAVQALVAQRDLSYQ